MPVSSLTILSSLSAICLSSSSLCRKHVKLALLEHQHLSKFACQSQHVCTSQEDQCSCFVSTARQIAASHLQLGTDHTEQHHVLDLGIVGPDGSMMSLFKPAELSFTSRQASDVLRLFLILCSLSLSLQLHLLLACLCNRQALHLLHAVCSCAKNRQLSVSSGQGS